MNEADDIRRSVALARHAMEELDRAIAELEQLARPVDMEAEAAAWRDRNIPRMVDHITPDENDAEMDRMDALEFLGVVRGDAPVCGNCGGKGDAHESWCGKDEGDCP